VDCLRQRSLAKYRDVVLLPALQLAQMDLQQRAIGPEQRVKARTVVVKVIEPLGTAAPSPPKWRRRGSVLDEDLAHYLRLRTEAGRRIPEHESLRVQALGGRHAPSASLG